MSAIRVFLAVLAIVFLAEVGVMFLLPAVFPAGVHPRVAAVVDSCLLTLLSAPALWWIIVRPLRRTAVREQAKAESIVAAAIEGIITVDQDGTVESFNRAAEQIFGYPAGEVVGREVTMLMPGRFVSQHDEAIQRYRRTGEPAVIGRTIEVPGLRKDGGEVPLAVSVTAVRWEGRLLFTGIVRDLTEAKRIERERKSRARQQAMMVAFGKRALACTDLDRLLGEAAGCITETLGVEIAGVLEQSPDGKALVLRAGVGWKDGMVGQAGIDLGADGPAEEDLLGEPALVVEDFHDEGGYQGPALLEQHAVASGASVTIRGADGPFGVLGAYSTRPRRFAEDEVHFLLDISFEITLAIQRKRVELQERERDRLRAEQMAVVAQIATGVAHEIRNPLTAIKMLVQTARADGEAEGLESEDLRMIEEEIRRLDRSLQTFLDFARPPKPDPRPVDLRELVERTFALVAVRAVQQCVVLEFRRPPSPVVVEADWEHIQQLLLNLALNALDAMPRSGTLEVVVRGPAEGEIELRVLDTGPGIDPAVLPRLFQPFVTGKRTGVGLGLVVSRRIAEDHGGSLTAANRPEGGACFVLRLPVTSRASAS